MKEFFKDYTIAETYTLPSKGEIYDFEINPEVKIRSMTTLEEMKRLGFTGDRVYQLLSELIDDCIVDGLGVATYDLALGDFLFLVYKLRVVTYGADYPLMSRCPYCGKEIKSVINLDELPIKYDLETFNSSKQIILPCSGAKVVIKPDTPRILDNITVKTKEFKLKYPDYTLDISLVYKLMEIIESIDDKKPNQLTFEDLLKTFPMKDVNYILNASNYLNQSIGIDNTIRYTCDKCGSTYDSLLRTNNEFFRPEVRF